VLKPQFGKRRLMGLVARKTIVRLLAAAFSASVIFAGTQLKDYAVILPATSILAPSSSQRPRAGTGSRSRRRSTESLLNSRAAISP
jgi:hypothetical protein